MSLNLTIDKIQLGPVLKGESGAGCLIHHIKNISAKAATLDNPLMVECMKSPDFYPLVKGDCPNTVENRQKALDLLVNSCKTVGIVV